MSLAVDDVPPIAKGSGPSAAEVFIAWERLRLLYNGLLVAWTLFLGRDKLGNPSFQEMLIVGAIVANLGFCLGVTAEGYLALLGLPRRPARWFLFVVGTLTALLAAAIHIASPPVAMMG
jgi:hypothetical protein